MRISDRLILVFVVLAATEDQLSVVASSISATVDNIESVLLSGVPVDDFSSHPSEDSFVPRRSVIAAIRDNCSSILDEVKSRWNELPRDKQAAILRIGGTAFLVGKSCFQMRNLDGRCQFVSDMAGFAVTYCMSHGTRDLAETIEGQISAFCTAVHILAKSECEY